DGTGTFTDVTASHLPAEDIGTMWSALIDLDGDGTLDRLAGNMGDLTGRTADEPLRAYRNDGTGRFTRMDDALPSSATGNVFAIVVADFDGDGRDDVFLASRGGLDRLLLRAESVA